jgi:Uncharacterized protein involved in exopolysaccharide biosynthesis
MNDNENIGLKSIIVDYLMHWKLFLGAFFVSLVIAILYLVIYPRTYEMVAAVQLQDDKESMAGGLGLGDAAGLMKSFGLGGASSGGFNLEDEKQIFKSVQLFNRVVSDLNLNVQYRRPFSFYRLYDETYYVLTPDSIFDKMRGSKVVFSVSFKNGQYVVDAEDKRSGNKSFSFSSLPASIAVQAGIFTLDYSDSNINKETPSINITYVPISHSSEDLIDEFFIDDFSKSANIIELGYKDYETTRGLDILNALIANYNSQAFEYKNQSLSKIELYYSNRIDSVMSELFRIEEVIEQYKHKNRLTDIQIDIQFYADQMKELQASLIELQAQDYSMTLMSDFVSNPENKYNLVPMLLGVETGEKSTISLYNELLLERARVIQNSGLHNPLVTSLTGKVDELRQSVFLTIENAKKAINLSIRDLNEKEKALYAKMEEYPLQEREFLVLRRQQEVLQGVYLLLLQKKEEASLTANNEKEKARVIETPYIKSKPVGPRKLYAAIMMLLFTMIVPVVYLSCSENLKSIIQLYKERK